MKDRKDEYYCLVIKVKRSLIKTLYQLLAVVMFAFIFIYTGYKLNPCNSVIAAIPETDVKPPNVLDTAVIGVNGENLTSTGSAIISYHLISKYEIKKDSDFVNQVFASVIDSIEQGNYIQALDRLENTRDPRFPDGAPGVFYHINDDSKESNIERSEEYYLEYLIHKMFFDYCFYGDAKAFKKKYESDLYIYQVCSCREQSIPDTVKDMKLFLKEHGQYYEVIKFVESINPIQGDKCLDCGERGKLGIDKTGGYLL